MFSFKMFLLSIPVDSYFNIVGFGNNYEFLFPKSVKYNEQTLKAGMNHVEGKSKLSNKSENKPFQVVAVIKNNRFDRHRCEYGRY